MNVPSPNLSRAEQIKRQVKNISTQVDDAVREAATESLILESGAYEREELAKLVLKNQRRRDNNELRKEYARKAHELAAASVIVWIILFVANAVAKGAANVSLLSDQALIAFTAGATVNVLAAFLAIVKGLYPTKG